MGRWFTATCVLLLWSVSISAETLTQKDSLYATPDEGPKVVFSQGRPLVAYFDQERILRLTSLDGESSLILSQEPGTKNSFVGFYQEDEALYAVWRPQRISGEQRGDKHIRFRASYDGGHSFSESRQLDSGGGAFHPRISVSGRNVYVLWLDQRTAGEYHVYLNHSGDQGRSWLAQDKRMDGDAQQAYEPFLAAHRERAAVGWLEPGNPYRVQLRYTRNAGEQWSEAINLPTPADARIFTPAAVYTQIALLVFYYADKQGMMLTVSTDDGASWQEPVVLPGTQAIGSSGFQLASNSRGDVCLVWPGPFSLLGRKADIYVSCSHDGGTSWDAAVRLNSNTPGLSHSLAPAIAMDEQGRVVVIWQDLRAIRPDIYGNYSLDGGRSWLAEDIRISRDMGRRHAQFPSLSSDGQGRFVMVWQDADSDNPINRRFNLAYDELIVRCAQLVSQPERNLCVSSVEPSPEQRKQRLIARVETFWNAYVAGEFLKGYELMDPFFRARMNAMQFAARLGQIDYLAFELPEENISIQENRAKISIKITFEAQQLQIGAHVQSIPRTEQLIEEEWIWLDGDWFKIYQTQNGDFLPQI